MMIEINLLPHEAKAKKAQVTTQAGYFIYLVISAFTILLCIHLYFLILGIAQNIALRSLRRTWNQFKPQRDAVANFKKENDTFLGQDKIMDKLLAQRVDWAPKLNKLSLHLPSGIWFNELQITDKKFILKASTLSLQKEEITTINKFTDNIKNDEYFLNVLVKIELTSTQRRTLSGYELVDFILEGELK